MSMRNKILVLLADDSEQDRQMIKQVLVPMDIEITETSTGEETLTRLESEEFDCLLLDQALPDYKGIQLIKEIRKRGIRTPIVILTEKDDAMLAVKMVRAGAQDYLPKQKVNPDLIYKSILNAITLKQKIDEIESFKEFYNSAPVGFYTTCVKTGRFLKANEFCVKMLGCEDFEELNKKHRVTNFYPSTKRRKLIEVLKIQGSITDYELELTLPDGDKRWTILTARYCHKNGTIEGSITDITQRKLLEEQLNEYKEKEINQLKAIRSAARARMHEGCAEELHKLSS